MSTKAIWFAVYTCSDPTNLSSQQQVGTYKDDQQARRVMKELLTNELQVHPEWGATRENEKLLPNVLEIIGADGGAKLRYEVCKVVEDKQGEMHKVLLPEMCARDAKARSTDGGGKEDSPMAVDDVAPPKLSGKEDRDTTKCDFRQSKQNNEDGAHMSETRSQPPSPLSEYDDDEESDSLEEPSSAVSNKSIHIYPIDRPVPHLSVSQPATRHTSPALSSSTSSSSSTSEDDGVRYGLYMWTKTYTSRGLELRTLHKDRGSAEADRTACTLSHMENLKTRNRPDEKPTMVGGTVEFHDNLGDLTARIVIKEGSIIFGNEFITREDEAPQKRSPQTYEQLDPTRREFEPVSAPVSVPAPAPALALPIAALPQRKEAPAPGMKIPEGLFCVCHGIDDGREMVGCENDDCPYNGWFHLQCLGLAVAPEEEQWFCPECRQPKPEPAGKKGKGGKIGNLDKVKGGRVTKSKAKAGGRTR